VTTDADAFSVQLLDEAKGFLEKAEELDDAGEVALRDAYLHASLVVGFSALESHINGLAAELAPREGWDILEQSILLEKTVKFNKGQWTLGETQFFRLEDRLEFLFVSHGDPEFKAASWWSVLHEGIITRNKFVHPKDTVECSVSQLKRYLDSIMEALNSLYMAIFKRGHPAYGRGLQSTLSF
jgi:hypothetical protein